MKSCFHSSPLFTHSSPLGPLLRPVHGFYYDLHQASIKTCDRPLLSLVWASVEFGSSLFWIRFKYEIKFTYGLVTKLSHVVQFIRGEEWWRVVKSGANSSPLATPVFIGVSGESVKSEECFWFLFSMRFFQVKSLTNMHLCLANSDFLRNLAAQNVKHVGIWQK